MASDTKPRISYTRAELLVLNPGKIRISRQLFSILQELKICNAKRTHRGCRGGRHKQRKIACVESSGATNPFEESTTQLCETAAVGTDVKIQNGETVPLEESTTTQQPCETAHSNVKIQNGSTIHLEESTSTQQPCEVADSDVKIHNGAAVPLEESTTIQQPCEPGHCNVKIQNSATSSRGRPIQSHETADTDVKALHVASSTVCTVKSIESLDSNGGDEGHQEIRSCDAKMSASGFMSDINRVINLDLMSNQPQVSVCDIDEAVLAKLKKFRLRKEKTNAAIVLKIDPDALKVIEDTAFDEDDLQDMDPDTLGTELPAHSPRYVAYSYVLKHDDGRISYPLCFIFSSPEGCKPEAQMMYAGSKLEVVNQGQFTKVFEVRNPEEITEEWLKSKLSFFR